MSTISYSYANIPEVVNIKESICFRGDDLGELTETAWPELYIPEPLLGDLTGEFRSGFSGSDSVNAYLTYFFTYCMHCRNLLS